MVARHVFRMEEVPLTELRPGLFGKVYPGAEMTLVRWIFQPGTPRTGMHVHTDHEQYGLVVQGRVEMQVGDEIVELGPGDIYWAPRNLPHGRTLVLGDVPAHILDIFVPAREEYVATAAQAARVPQTKE
jgi:quercetin dioxygenase-like cupin family protein